MSAPIAPGEVADNLVLDLEGRRVRVGDRLDPQRQTGLGQYFTPAAIARYMGALFEMPGGNATLLDPGAGIGVLAAAVAERWSPPDGSSLHIDAFEIDATLVDELKATLQACRAVVPSVSGTTHAVDFIEWAAEQLSGAGLYTTPPSYDMVVMNPPYGKLGTTSRERKLLKSLRIDAANLYTAFLALAAKLLRPGGQLVAITPRSFCNGPYFKKFRTEFLAEMTLTHLHVFESRSSSFKDNDVLQENIIFRAVKGAPRDSVKVSASDTHADDDVLVRRVPYAEVVRPDDSESFIHLVPDAAGAAVGKAVRDVGGPLASTGIEVATGPVVDFRAKEALRKDPGPGAVPLLYPVHLSRGRVVWPAPTGRKPNAIRKDASTSKLLLPSGTYVLVKRFTSKEERRRVVAAVLSDADVPGDEVGIENHLNVFHSNGRGLDEGIAWGLAAYLNSSAVDLYFRQFSGHTQVNATDLRLLPYPPAAVLAAIGRELQGTMPPQPEIDDVVGKHVPVLDSRTWELDTLAMHKRVSEALDVLKALDVPKAQQNERTALTLLALLDLTPDKAWEYASAPLRGITQMMGFFREVYGKDYAPNTRETVRRQSVHQLLAAGLIVINPDKPDRPVNSGQTTYQVEPSTLDLLRTHGTPEWEERLVAFRQSAQSLREKWAAEREMARIPVVLPQGEATTLSAGGQNVLMKEVIEEFCSRYTPGGRVLYVGDADEKFAIYEEDAFLALGIHIPEHGKMPDLIVLDEERGWLVLIEAVTSHGPIDAKRLEELRGLFAESPLPLVFVTTFLTRKDMARFLDTISWETDVWVAESPSHLIHFNGERFLGPEE